MTPSPSLTANLRNELLRWPPFAQMAPEHVDRFIQSASQSYHEPDEVVLSPADGAVTQLCLIRRGSISGRAADSGGEFQCEAGDLLPIGAALAARPVSSNYTADVDTFCLQLPLPAMNELAAQSAPFADFLNRRVHQFLELSRQSLQVAFAAQTLAEQSLETHLGDLLRRAAVGVAPDTPLVVALRLMHEQRIGSVLVLAPGSGAALGILTRHDILGRVTLAQRGLDTPISEVMSAPVFTLSAQHSAQDAALAMARHGIRHVPVTDPGGRVVGLLSERDLFALQRVSLKQLSTALRAAPDVAALTALAHDIRALAGNLLGQGVGARQLTALISHLNDLLTERLVGLLAPAHGIDMAHGCWLAFGSEGRSEQTVATDQDNGIVFASDNPERDRPAWLGFALAVNQALDACGYPLCKGNVMASNPDCCLSQAEWLARFEAWIGQGAPEDLLKASIYFDLRPLAGAVALALPLRERVAAQAARNPRFLKQLAENALHNRPALNWLGGIETQSQGAQALLNLKLHGTMICVDAARLFALAHGITATGTRERFEAAARSLGVPEHEAQAWSAGFEFLQMLRLRAQRAIDPGAAADGGEINPNLIDVNTLNDIDRRMLKESLRVARLLQQRIELDYRR